MVAVLESEPSISTCTVIGSPARRWAAKSYGNDHRRRAASVMRSCSTSCSLARPADQAEVAGADHLLRQVAALGRLVVVEDGQRHVVDVVADAVAVHDQHLIG